MTPLWNQRPLREPPNPGWGLTDQKTKLPKCKNAALRQPLPSFLLKVRPQRPPTDFGYSEGSVSGVCQWQEAGFSRATGYHGRHAEASPVRPRIVTVVRPCGKEGVRKISLLLNRRAVQTFEQLMADISEALGLPCWNNARLRRLFSPMGREIHGLADFFRFDNAFLGFGNNRPTLNEVEAALEELYPGNPSYCEHLMKLWDRILRPKATKADSGFHDDDPGAEKSLEAAPDQQVNQPSVNNLQPVGVKNEKARKDNQKVERQFWKKKNELQKEDKKELKREDKKKPIYCRNCRGHGPPLPPIKSGKNTSSQSNINSSGNPQSQKTEKNDANPNTSPRTTHRNALETRSSTPAQLMRKKDICSYLLPDGAEVTFEDIERCYEMGRVVGDGNFAVVRECRVRGLAEMFAMKIVDSAKLQGRGHMIKNEIALLQRLEHPRLIRLFRSHHTNIHVYILMELVSGGDLFDAISQSGRFSERSSACMIRDVSQALEYIHSKSIAHRDIKPENLLVQRHSNGTLNLKLADFGLAMVITEPVFTVCGTPTYVAPEILAETGYGVEVDVWAMGVILFVLLSGFPPFRSADRNQEELFRLIQKGELLFLSPYWDTVSEGAKSLVRALLEVDPKMRLSATETLQDVWLQQVAAQKDQRSAGKDLADRKDQLKPSRESLKADKMPENGTTKYERNNNGQEHEHLNHHRQHKTSFPQDTTIRK